MDHRVDAGDDIAKKVTVEGKRGEDAGKHVAQGTTESLQEIIGDEGSGKDQISSAGSLPCFSHEVT